ncbi:hypothetical protein A6J63_002260 [Yersinia enterocolitica]|nr:hypothetical protein A6J63_002260 [Yersinia enterocolitica]
MCFIFKNIWLIIMVVGGETLRVRRKFKINERKNINLQSFPNLRFICLKVFIFHQYLKIGANNLFQNRLILIG